MSTGAMSSSQASEIQRVCEAFRSAWALGHRPRIETYLEAAGNSRGEELLERLILLELALRAVGGEKPSVDDYLDRFPDHAERIVELHREVCLTNELDHTSSGPGVEGETFDRDDQDVIGLTLVASSESIAGSPASVEPVAQAPATVGSGRYHLIRLLGKGSFGRVYLARDVELDREVAIKVISAGQIGSLARREALVAEGKIVARLRHPAIVAVHDIGSDKKDEVFVVLEYVPGTTLALEFAKARPTPPRLAAILYRVAEAVHHAHIATLVHRDLKPANILIDSRGMPFVADFGLAISEEMQRLRSGEIAGTPSYMAPEQVRGEAHRLDGRTDVWAIGVILYEGMAGRLPFTGISREALFEDIQTRDPRPVRQIDDRLPRELERITLKCLAKRMTDRYQTAADLAEDLRAWLDTNGPNAWSMSSTSTSWYDRGSSLVSRGPGRVVMKGLRAFDTEDAAFFLSLLPGPRDRDGLPNSIRHWKARIEGRDRDSAFAVGLMYGPSGSGKSSMIKAGLLPRLAEDIRPIYVESTPGTTEARLSAALRRDFPGIPQAMGLVEVAASIREGSLGPGSGKVLVVLDQFEQWLQSHVEPAETELVRALRQADGRRLQVILLVRDDFWMAVVRFMRALEIPLVEGGNSSAVELFEPAHARKVLIELGRAEGNLPPEPASPGPEASSFLDLAVEGLAGKDGRVIAVRLILFAEVVRHRPWTPATLTELGGIEGIGVTFLEETFSEDSSPPTHRYHRLAAQAVLKALLPESNSDLKGTSRSASELQEAAGYVERPNDFAELLSILDAELRMVTPSDPEGPAGRGGKGSGDACFQLTHDYLIPPLRTWLNRARQGTRKGRAESRLEQITAYWRDRPGSRRLPSAFEWAAILIDVGPRSWSGDAGRMMRSATRYHLFRASLTLGLVLCLLGGGWYASEWSVSNSLLRQVLKADFAEFPGLVPEIKPRHDWLRRSLERIETGPGASDSRERRVAGALLFLDRPTHGRAVFLHRWLRQADPAAMALVLTVLSEHPNDAEQDRLIERLRDAEEDLGARLRAACALAAINPDRDDCSSSAPVIVQALLAEDQAELGRWLELLGPLRMSLVIELKLACQRRDLDPSARGIAAEALADILEGEGNAIALASSAVRILPQASNILARRLAKLERLDGARSFLAAVVRKDQRSEAPPDGWEGDEGVLRRANAAFALLAMESPSSVWPLLQLESDPTLRSHLIRRMGEAPVSRSLLLERLRLPLIEGAERQALLLTLAEADPKLLLPHDRAACEEIAAKLHREAPEPGIHSAAELLLRRLDRADLLRDSPDKPIQGAAPSGGSTGVTWYRGPNGHTFAVLPSPLQFWMGSPASNANPEDYYNKYERRHFRQIDRTLAVATTEVTRSQIEAFDSKHSLDHEHSTGEPDAPANKVSWYAAARYCNWLSEQAGIPKDQWCYPDTIGPGMSVPAEAVERQGYRLPTEAEWEGFCRAATRSTRPFGRAAELLPRYGWHSLNADERSRSVGRLLPNDFGLFDVLGNVWEWCHDGTTPGIKFEGYSNGTLERPSGDPIRSEVIVNDGQRVIRGGGFDWAPSMNRSSRRYWMSPAADYPYLGFRVVRTLPKKEPSR